MTIFLTFSKKDHFSMLILKLIAENDLEVNQEAQETLTRYQMLVSMIEIEMNLFFSL